MSSNGVLTAEAFKIALATLARRDETAAADYILLHSGIARQVDWYTRRPLMRKVYRAVGFPFGRNQGSFKRWALLVGRYP